MKERPILFSTPMVKAILAGNKTQTRRICKHQHWSHSELIDVNKNIILQKVYQREVSCTYGQPGDVLWVREKFMIDIGGGIHYCASEKYSRIDRWKPSIHLPKSAARIWLQIESIRVERLQDISERDAVKEGILSYEDPIIGSRYKDYMADASGYGHPDEDYPTVTSAIDSFKSLWQFINGEDSWNSNPWVWAITFKVLSTTGKNFAQLTDANHQIQKHSSLINPPILKS